MKVTITESEMYPVYGYAEDQKGINVSPKKLAGWLAANKSFEKAQEEMQRALMKQKEQELLEHNRAAYRRRLYTPAPGLAVPAKPSNPLSRIPDDSFVWDRGAGIGWTCLAGPMPFHKAHAAAHRMEEHNTTGKQMYAATRSPELVGKIKPGDHMQK